MKRGIYPVVATLVALMVLLVAQPQSARAHCDTMDGPVIIEAQRALDNGDVTPLLKWVKAGHEAEVRSAFDKARAVRGQGGQVKDIADHYFLETLVRVHREGENAPYTGIKPAGMQEPVIIAADQALDKASAAELERQLLEAVKAGLQERFQRALETRQHAAHTVDAGREFVAAYVEYMHYIERLHNDAVTSAAHGGEQHEERAAAPACGHHK